MTLIHMTTPVKPGPALFALAVIGALVLAGAFNPTTPSPFERSLTTPKTTTTSSRPAPTYGQTAPTTTATAPPTTTTTTSPEPTTTESYPADTEESAPVQSDDGNYDVHHHHNHRDGLLTGGYCAHKWWC